MKKHNVASASEVAATAVPANIRFVEVTGDVGRQRLTGSGDVRQEEEGGKVVEFELYLCGRCHTAEADAVCVAAPDGGGGGGGGGRVTA